jgi:hypothetical protein
VKFLRTTPPQSPPSLMAQLLLLLWAAVAVRGATFTVVSPLDSGPGSLRAAIDAANALPGDDVVCNF